MLSGMTEFGMGLTNPLHGPRIPGSVGRPFPQVEACIAQPNVYAEKGYDVIAQGNAHSTRLVPGKVVAYNFDFNIIRKYSVKNTYIYMYKKLSVKIHEQSIKIGES